MILSHAPTGSSGPASWPATENGTASHTLRTRSAQLQERPARKPGQPGRPPWVAISQVDGIDLTACTDGDLWLRRGTYERETAWAPPHVAEELRLMRLAERDAHVNAIRAEHECRAAADEQTAARHQQLAGIWRALEAKASKEAAMFTAAQDTRQQWEAVTETTRRIAIAADIELRRRHPGMQLEPLRPHPNEAVSITYPDEPGAVREDVGSRTPSMACPASPRTPGPARRRASPPPTTRRKPKASSRSA